jgi:CPA1 family monovalent cation:H+ antiporter
MIHSYLLLTITLLFAVLLLVMVGERLKISYPIFLVIGGLLISFVPGIPSIAIDPDLVFLIFLPPILYAAAWYTSWHDFWKWKRPIGLLAVGLVILTSTIIAYLTEWMIPGFPLAAGFLLGGIISPPDAVAATSVLQGMAIPKRAIIILEGESLINDASSLIVFKFALAAILTHSFVLQEAVGTFFLMAGMGIVVGLLVALAAYHLHRLLPTTPSIDIALTLITPYVMYIGAEYFHFSGVLAVVSGGLFLSYRSHKFLSSQARIQATVVWQTLIFLLNGTVFILIGLDLPFIVQGLREVSQEEAIIYGLIISLALIVIRVIWTYTMTFIPRFLFRSIRETEKSPGWKGPFVVSFAAMRGVVSLAAALSIPLLLPGGEAFPFRNLVLFLTFVVILVTLVGQGLLLPWIIRWIKVEEIDPVRPDGEQEAELQLYLKQASLKLLTEKHARYIELNPLVANLRSQLESDIALTSQRIDSFDCNTREQENYRRVLTDILTEQREELVKLRDARLFSEEVLRKQAAQLDLDEARLRGGLE